MLPVSPIFHTVVTAYCRTQKRSQSESIYSTILDVYVLTAERQNFNSSSFLLHPAVETEFHTGNPDPLSNTSTEDRLRHASGPVYA